MQNLFITIIEAIILTSALSIDAFVASFAYGSNKIKIPMKSIHIINIICSSMLGISLFAGYLLKSYLSEKFTIIFCFSILFLLGLTHLLDGITKSIIRKYNHVNKQVTFSMFNFKFILGLYANPEKADVDSSKIISSMEAVSLAFALSLDGMAVGFGAVLGNINGWAILICSLIINVVAIMLGCFFGTKISRKLPFNASWLSGIILIVLAFLKLC